MAAELCSAARGEWIRSRNGPRSHFPMRKLLPVVVIAGFVGFVAWLFHTPPPAAPVVAASTTTPKPAAPKYLAPQSIAAPTAPPALKPGPASPAATMPLAADNSGASTVQTEVGAAIDDMVSLMQAGDLLTAMEKYMPPDELAKIPPEEKAMMEQQMQQAMAQPRMQQMMQSWSQGLQSLKDQTPQINATNDEATYQMTPPAGMIPPGANAPPTIPMVFQKIDGRWYVKPGNGGP